MLLGRRTWSLCPPTSPEGSCRAYQSLNVARFEWCDWVHVVISPYSFTTFDDTIAIAVHVLLRRQVPYTYREKLAMEPRIARIGSLPRLCVRREQPRALPDRSRHPDPVRHPSVGCRRRQWRIKTGSRHKRCF